MTALDLFTYAGQDVRVITEAGEPWFVAADLARLLGYRDAANATRIVDEDMRGTQIVSTPGGEQEMTVISEPGLYRLIMRSHRPEARAIERWVVTDVLPTIRRTGAYSAPAAAQVDVSTIDRRTLAVWLIEAEDARAVAEAKVAELEPAAQAWEQLASAQGDYSVADAAQVLSRAPGIKVGRQRLFTVMAQRGWLYRHGADGRWRIYQRAVDTGYLCEMPSSHYHPRTGELVLDPPQVRVTVKGLRALHASLSSATQMALVPQRRPQG